MISRIRNRMQQALEVEGRVGLLQLWCLIHRLLWHQLQATFHSLSYPFHRHQLLPNQLQVLVSRIVPFRWLQVFFFTWLLSIALRLTTS